MPLPSGRGVLGFFDKCQGGIVPMPPGREVLVCLCHLAGRSWFAFGKCQGGTVHPIGYITPSGIEDITRAEGVEGGIGRWTG